MSTVEEVKYKALEVLSVLSIGQVPSSEDLAKATQLYSSAFRDLRNDGLATWIEAGPVPDEVVPHLVALMAFDGTGEYGVSPIRYDRIVFRASGAKKAIRRLVRPRHEGLDPVVDF